MWLCFTINATYIYIYIHNGFDNWYIYTQQQKCCFQLAFKKRGNGRERIWNSRKSGKVCSQDKNFFLLKKINTKKRKFK